MQAGNIQSFYLTRSFYNLADALEGIARIHQVPDSPAPVPSSTRVAMSLYFRTLYAWKCKGTHHKLAMEAIRQLPGEQGTKWQELFLKHIETYLTGSKDPDRKFRDFRNHVLHVGEDFWGGAIQATHKWYAQARDAFADKRWKQGVYASGVMSHYLTDVFCPLHTGQSEQETKIHRACEWSVSCSFDDLLILLEEDLGGMPEISLEDNESWLETLIRNEASHAYSMYETIVETYDFELGAEDPPAGLNEDLQIRFAELLGRASVALSLVLDRCLQESGQHPPWVSLSLPAALSQASLPVFWITQNLSNAAERRIVTRIYNEVKTTGKLVENLPEENRVVQELLEKFRKGEPQEPEQETEPVKVPAKKQRIKVKAAPEPVKEQPDDPPGDPFAAEAEAVFGARPNEVELPEETDEAEEVYAPDSQSMTSFAESDAETPEARDVIRIYLEDDSPIVDAPSIGPKTAGRLRKVNINTVGDFLDADPVELVKRLNTRWITQDLVEAWQQQAELMCTVPGLRGHDTQLLTGVGVETAVDLANTDVQDLLSLVMEYASSPEGQRIIRSGALPDYDEVMGWVMNAQQVQQHRAA